MATTNNNTKSNIRRGGKIPTAVCGVFSPSLHDPPIAPKRVRADTDLICPRCSACYSRVDSVRQHFPKCIALNGNPDKYSWWDALDDNTARRPPSHRRAHPSRRVQKQQLRATASATNSTPRLTYRLQSVLHRSTRTVRSDPLRGHPFHNGLEGIDPRSLFRRFIAAASVVDRAYVREALELEEEDDDNEIVRAWAEAHGLAQMEIEESEEESEEEIEEEIEGESSDEDSQMPDWIA